jgi:hypothetical protein
MIEVLDPTLMAVLPVIVPIEVRRKVIGKLSTVANPGGNLAGMLTRNDDDLLSVTRDGRGQGRQVANGGRRAT